MIYQATDNNSKLAEKLILEGEIIVYPTDTLYGMGVDATNKKAINKLNQLKGRISPLSIIVNSEKMIKKYIDIKFSFKKDLNKYLPGPFTILLNNFNNMLPEELSQGTNKIGIRIPKSSFILKVVKNINRPIVTTSVNYHNMKPLDNVDMINKQFNKLSIFAEDINLNSLGSTIIDYTCSPKQVLRQGDGKI
jgi:L-threonylcarbamoyladenylate synthase